MKNIFLVVVITLLVYQSKAQKLTSEQEAAKKVTVDFFKWYRNNSDRINNFQLYKGKNTKDQPPFVIDWKEVEKYFSYIRKSVPQLGEAWINWERENFKNAQVYMTQHPEDEIIPGFDYDRFTGGQESAKYMVDDLLFSKQTKISVKMNGTDKADVFYTYTFSGGGDKVKDIYKVKVAKEKGKWKISKGIEAVE